MEKEISLVENVILDGILQRAAEVRQIKYKPPDYLEKVNQQSDQFAPVSIS